MIVSKQVQQPMDDQDTKLSFKAVMSGKSLSACRFDGDDHITYAGFVQMRRVLRSGGKRQNIGGFVLVPEVTIQPPNGSIADENDRERLTVKKQLARK